ncbi:hypothetical protein PENSPDRAFT_737627 [Peniophora sp. CONT]|nr:hypothetical protein PENSPDRAFT_737627 [Peniophora sp. CONT]
MNTVNSPPVIAQRLNADTLFLIFSLVVARDRPALCSCPRHAPNQAELRQRPCCENASRECRGNASCVFGKHSNPDRCTHNLGWITLGHVCQQWRSALHGMNIFWANDLCALNNAAVVGFLPHTGSAPLNIDLSPEKVQNMLHPATRRERAEILRPHVHKAGVLRSGWYNWIPATLGEQSLPLLEMLVLSTEVPSTVIAPNLRHTVSNVGPLYHSPTHATSDGALILQAPLIHTMHLRNWSLLRCGEIPRMLTAVPSITKLVLNAEDHLYYPPSNMVDEDDAEDVQVILNLHDTILHLPSLLAIQVTGRVAEHPIIRRLLAHLVADSQNALQQLFLRDVEPSFLGSRVALDALKTHIRAIHPDRISLHFREVSRVFIVSVARQKLGCSEKDYPAMTIRLNLRNAPQSCVSILKATLFPLIPLEQVLHLYIDGLPDNTGTQFLLSSALRRLGSVHTLHLRSGQTESSSLLSIGTYPMVGLRGSSDPWLPSLTRLHINYPSHGSSPTWWKELAAALIERKGLDAPFRTLCIIVNREPVRFDDSAVEMIQRALAEVNFDDRISPATSLESLNAMSAMAAEHNRWTRDKIEDVARKMYGQVVETIEVVEGTQDGWPPGVEPWSMRPHVPDWY